MHDGIVKRMEIKIDHVSSLFCFFLSHPPATTVFRLDRDETFTLFAAQWFMYVASEVCRREEMGTSGGGG